MSLFDLIDSIKSPALANRLYQNEAAYWRKICRQYSKAFSVSLQEVYNMDPEKVCLDLFEDQLQELDLDENLNDIEDLLNSLKDPNYNIEKERKMREEMAKIVEEEERRLAAHEPIHPSLKGQKTHQNRVNSGTQKGNQELPKSGGINMDVINRLANEEKEGGEF